MYSSVVVVVLVATLVGGQPIDDQTLEGVSQLLSSGAITPYGPAPKAPYPPQEPPQQYPYWEQQSANVPQGFTVQSGYEGIIAPTGPDHDGPSALQKLGGVALGAGLLKHFLPFPLNKIVLALGSKLGVFVISIVLLVLVGGAATTAVCALTPICTISFLGLRFNKENVRSFFSQDRLDSITEFVHNAFEKYQQLQARHGKAFVSKGKKLKYAKLNKEEVKDKVRKEAREAKQAETATTENTQGEKREVVEADLAISREGRELNEKEVENKGKKPKDANENKEEVTEADIAVSRERRESNEKEVENKGKKPKDANENKEEVTEADTEISQEER